MNNIKNNKFVWFPNIQKIKYEGIESTNPLAFLAIEIFNI